jgi:RNA exonuclease 1
MTLGKVKEKLGNLASSQTILIGHGLENDLIALKLFHDRCMDTCHAFPHPRLYPERHRFSLQHLTSTHLKRLIQQGEHDSKEDSVACLELIKKLVE